MTLARQERLNRAREIQFERERQLDEMLGGGYFSDVMVTESQIADFGEAKRARNIARNVCKSIGQGYCSASVIRILALNHADPATSPEAKGESSAIENDPIVKKLFTLQELTGENGVYDDLLGSVISRTMNAETYMQIAEGTHPGLRQVVSDYVSRQTTPVEAELNRCPIPALR